MWGRTSRIGWESSREIKRALMLFPPFVNKNHLFVLWILSRPWRTACIMCFQWYTWCPIYIFRCNCYTSNHPRSLKSHLHEWCFRILLSCSHRCLLCETKSIVLRNMIGIWKQCLCNGPSYLQACPQYCQTIYAKVRTTSHGIWAQVLHLSRPDGATCVVLICRGSPCSY